MCFEEVPGRFGGAEDRCWKPCSEGGEAIGVEVVDNGLWGRCVGKPGTTGDSGKSICSPKVGLVGARSILSVGLSSLYSEDCGSWSRSVVSEIGLKASSGLKREVSVLFLICRLGTRREVSSSLAIPSRVDDSIDTLDEAETVGLKSDLKLCVDDVDEAESEEACTTG